jgi:hypothetical protein
MKIKTLEVALRSIGLQPIIKIAENKEVVIYTGMVVGDEDVLVFVPLDHEFCEQKPKQS